MGIVYCLEGKYLWVLLLIGIALLADFADGLVARALNVKSELGKQLDSLADGVTFGVLPGVIFYVLIENATNLPILQSGGNTANFHQSFFHLEHFGFLFPLFAAYRLGKFNIDTRQTSSFLGLATPAAALFVAGLLMIYYFKSAPFLALVENFYFLAGCIAALCALMVSEIPMFSFKINGLGWKGNETQIIFLLVCIPIIIFPEMGSLANFNALVHGEQRIDSFGLKTLKTKSQINLPPKRKPLKWLV
jgi:CDP-diacylglycerol--serine O-phosphatidyltransferase